ncbi:DNA/RNA polymerase [Panus rudis PR-1116 ss-1]|nr:DNA/RNA polymerase [Panus rudis PR-1116 ss-1]
MTSRDDNSHEPPSSQATDSLLKRLAGPSTTKAGLAKDQTEINRIIAEASKGSKYYENEKRKDKELTEKITKILKLRDEVRKGADIAHVERTVDHLIAKMEASRDLSQIIVHVDMDAFFANVEILDNPSLKGTAFGVGNGVLCTASYEARKFGIRSGMAEHIARKLHPELTVVPLHHGRYAEMSKKVMDIFRRYDPNMCPASVDEGYINITRYCEDHLIDAEECVRQMRAAVEKETGLTVSAGIAPNCMLAKICSDRNKPNGQFKLDFEPEAIKAFMHDLPIRRVPGVGRVNERLLESIGIKTCADIYTHRATLSLMDKHFGLHFLLQTYLGIASNVVQPWQREERKSIGAERTFSAISDKENIFQKLEEVAAELEHDMQSDGWTGKTVTLKYKLDTYQVFTRAKSFDRWISTKKEDLLAIGKELLIPELPLRIRLIGLRVTKLKDLRKSETGGIKRFFDSASGPSSPRKRARLDESHEDFMATLSQDGYEQTMPGFEEDHLHEDLEPIAKLEIGDEEDDAEIGAVSTPTRSLNAVDSSSKAPLSDRPSESRRPPADNGKSPPRSRRKGKSPVPADSELQAQTCPICNKTWETDNAGLNAHIDFCLSKSAILEAQVMASASSGTRSRGGGSPSKAKKPGSTKKPAKRGRGR